MPVGYVVPLLMCIVQLTRFSQFEVPRFTVYQVICERLEKINHITDAIECFHMMGNELAQEVQGNEANWVHGEDRASKQMSIVTVFS